MRAIMSKTMWAGTRKTFDTNLHIASNSIWTLLVDFQLSRAFSVALEPEVCKISLQP